MDIGPSSGEQHKENHSTQVPHNNNNNMLAPQQQHSQPSILLQVSSARDGSEFLRSSPLNALFLRDAYRHHPQENEPWRGSSGFGLANLLNRSVTNNSSAGSTGSVPPPQLPKFSLPSLHTFAKPLVSVKSEFSAGPPQHSMLKLQPRSPPVAVSMESVRENQPRPLAIHTSDPSERKPAGNSPPSSKETTPRKSNNNNARRIAPAPADDDEGDQDEEVSGGSIRGGRWTADEHERFLAGFRIHGHKWKRVQQVVRTRSVTQVRTHAQKYLLKVAKLKAEKKQGGKPIDVSALNDRYLSGRGADSSSDAEQGGTNTAPSSPDNAGTKDSTTRYHDDGFDGGERSPKPLRKKARPNVTAEHHRQHVDVLDQEYIAAAATTLCFLMSQKIDSLFDNRNDTMDKDLEPYDCYTEHPTSAAATVAAAVVAVAGEQEQGFAGGKSRKRAYMHFLTESPVRSAVFSFVGYLLA